MMQPRQRAACLLAAFVMCSGVAAAGRSLQQDALGNSDGCLATIPNCEAGACITRDVGGVARWVCLRCTGNYDPVTDTSGQDNIVQCVCPKGYYQNATISNSTCTRCAAGFYCLGGDRSETPASFGTATSCGDGLVTRIQGARSQVDCVAPAGYYMFSPTEARPCGTSEYAPMYNRLPKCMRCQSGLEEAPNNITDPSQRSSKRAVCKVPPGKFMSQGLVRPCAQGFFRDTYLDYDHPSATVCQPCNPGITTAGPGSKFATDCNKVIAGYGVSVISSNILNAPTPTQTANGLPSAGVCPIGTYSQGGSGGFYCVLCPNGTATRTQGAMAQEECVVPPGYVVPPGGNMTQCAAGTFRDSWVMYSDPKGAACTSCGTNITSEPRDLDQNPLLPSNTTAYVRGSSASCYIDAGQGMIAQGSNIFAGMDCPINTYGAAGRVYGWASAPCKPCPRNMVTDGPKSASSNACVNPDGYGYASEGATRCAVGFYAARGTLKPCQRCPDGRTTWNNPALQRYLTDCLVAPGNGVAFNLNAATAADVFNGDVVNFSPQQLAGLDVLQCPTGFYGSGLDVGGKCIPCPGSSTTEDAGATDISQCSVCLRGYGKNPESGVCELCPYGTWQPGGLPSCITCENTTFVAPIDGNGPAWETPAVTLTQGSVGAEWCVPTQSQLSPEAGQAYFGPSLQGLNILSINQNVSTLQDCFSYCPLEQCCFMQLDAGKQTCTVAFLQPAGPTETGLQLLYKLPANTLSSASSVADRAKAASRSQAGSSSNSSSSSSISSRHRQFSSVARRASLHAPRMSSGARLMTVTPRALKSAAAATARASASASTGAGVVRAKTLASGWFASCVIAPNDRSDWLRVGTPLTPDARTFTRTDQQWYQTASVYDCSELCDNSVVCSHFIWDPSNRRCLFRGGEDALGTRSFFQLPQPGSATGLLTGSDTYFYAFSGTGVSKPTLTSALATAFQTAVQQVLSSVLSADVLQNIMLWVDVASDTPDGTVLLAFYFTDPSAAASKAQLDATLALSNDATTRAIAAAMVQASNSAANPPGPAPELYSSLTTLAPAQVDVGFTNTVLGSPVAVDGCKLIPGYCGDNGSGSCLVNVCTCGTGFTQSGYTCQKSP